MGSHRFLVAVCPVCRRAFGMTAGTAKTTCPRCLNGFPSSLARKVGECEDQRELAEAVARVNAGLEGGPGDEGFRTPGGGGRAGGDPRPAGGGAVGGPGRGSEKQGEAERDPLEDIAHTVSEVPSQRDRAMAIARGLTARFGEFTRDQYADVAVRAGLEGEAGDWLEKLSGAELVSRPRGGVFRWV